MVNYNFEWDPEKAKTSYRIHGVSYEEATTVFRDPTAISIFDDMHSEKEERWITIGISNVGRLIVVCHTFQEYDKTNISIRIFSSRKAKKIETNQYKG